MLQIEITLTSQATVNLTENTSLIVRSTVTIDGEASKVVLLCEGLADERMIDFAAFVGLTIGFDVRAEVAHMLKHRLTFKSITI